MLINIVSQDNIASGMGGWAASKQSLEVPPTVFLTLAMLSLLRSPIQMLTQ